MAGEHFECCKSADAIKLFPVKKCRWKCCLGAPPLLFSFSKLHSHLVNNTCCREQGKKVVNGSEVILFVVFSFKGLSCKEC